MDEFSDDGFDDLNDTVLQELENNAIQVTQGLKLQSQPLQPLQPPQPDTKGQQPFDAYEYGLEDDDLDDTVVIDELIHKPLRPAENVPPHQRAANFAQQYHAPNPRPVPVQRPVQQPVYPPRPQYPTLTSSRPLPPPLPSQHYPSRPLPQTRPPPPPSQFVRPPLPISRPYLAQSSQALHSGPGKQHEIITALQTRLFNLEVELTSAKGEAAIMRSKFDKANTTHDAEVARLMKQNAEQVAKQERMVKSAMAAERTAATELQFARQDFREELDRAKSRKKDGPTTPKKNKTWGIADGFDGNEVTGSPSKTQAQKRKDAVPAVVPSSERTPTKGKRKRPAFDSPALALETHSGDDGDHDPIAAEPIPSRLVSKVLPYDFLRLALDHSPLHGQPLTFDLFSHFVFPSDPSQTFSSIIFQKLPHMGSPKQPLRLLVDFADLMLDMWRRCLADKYHAPIYYLAALLSYVLQLNTVVVAPHIIASLIPVCTTTCRLVVLPRFSSVDGDISQHPDSMVRQLYQNIDVTQALSLMYLAALGCMSPPSEDSELPLPPGFSPQVQFWKTVELELVMVMLSPRHPELDWLGMLSLLWTSVLPNSIGPIPNPISSTTYLDNGRNETETPEFVARGMVDRVSSYLSESPHWAAPGSPKEVLVRAAVMKTLVLFATSPFGLIHIAQSAVAIPRLTTVLCWAIDRMYDVDNPPPQQTPGRVYEGDLVEKDNTHTLLGQVISQALVLLHTLITDKRTADVVDMAAKLAASNGGAQRYLLTLARLNFAEEEGILDVRLDLEVAELAHELLELAVTPEEGEELGDVFGVV
ncbi:hypothetical protein B0T25DRAFT_503237 [Lasiosphaeria hispida]|uniref:DNA repair protein Rad26 n=1 Tax=Lasiosphaeria hispida TaxID=260671 RepID=A0AAJ0MF09_9PEZI|nr:hypothetical protein B0T25DRAFT_503237 [Lasiosphaeria hispida]